MTEQEVSSILRAYWDVNSHHHATGPYIYCILMAGDPLGLLNDMLVPTSSTQRQFPTGPENRHAKGDISSPNLITVFLSLFAR